MNDPRGSVWRKWDLHVHTPASFHWNDGTNLAKRAPEDRNKVLGELINKIEVSDVAVFGIMDYWTFDGYLAIRDWLTTQKRTISKAIFPGMELRIEAPVNFRLNIQVVLSDALTTQQLCDFKAALRISAIDRGLSNESLIGFARTLDPSKAKVHGFQEIDLKDEEKLLELGSKTALVTRESLRAAIKQVPPDTCLVILPYDTSDGLSKLDWEKHPHDDNYFMQSAHMFETREPDNVDLFQGRETEKNRKFIGNFLKTMGGKPKPAISGSDAHKIADYGVFPSNRITWIKADPTFEGLRQTLYEPLSRIAISAEKPLEPLLTIRKVALDFPADTKLANEVPSENQPDFFCFCGKTEVTFSSYLTCLIGGRGSGKSTLLNLIHEKLEPGINKFFKANHLIPRASATISACVSIDSDVDRKGVEFLQQNEIEGFATDSWRFTEAVFSRLVKLDDLGRLGDVNSAIEVALRATTEQAKRLKDHSDLLVRIADSERELSAKKSLIASFQNTEYQRINNEMGKLNRELQELKVWKERFQSLEVDFSNLVEQHNYSPSATPNGFEKEYFRILQLVNIAIHPIQSSEDLVSARNREEVLNTQVTELRQNLDSFLKGRGLSPENLADVGKANQRAAQLEQELPTLRNKAQSLKTQIDSFQCKRTLSDKYAITVQELLTPINRALQNLSKEVKQIELHYEFDKVACRHTLLEHIQDSFAETSLRIDHLESVLGDIDLLALTNIADFIQRLPEGNKTGKTLRDYYAIPLHFDLLRVEVERQLLEVGGFGRFRVLYDGRPIENTSFGQRCTAAIVVLLLLGNTPIVIDEPEAHLDSALIANYLVELVKTKKVNRQIIFATHNANFVVNGDAELIHVLEMGDDKKSAIVSTTIEDLTHRKELLRLEGGREAFLKREHRYGIAKT